MKAAIVVAVLLAAVETAGAASPGAVAVWRGRAFIAFPRPPGGAFTLVEAQWAREPAEETTVASTVFPPDLAYQTEGDCSALQSVRGLGVDYRGRLWVLDEGLECNPKMVVFDLRRNHEVARWEFPPMESPRLRAMVVDSVGPWGPRAYVADPGGKALAICSLRDRHCWLAALNASQDSALDGEQEGAGSPATWVSDMALSRREPWLYLSPAASDHLYYVDLSRVRSSTAPPEGHQMSLALHHAGHKLGPSTGLVADSRGGLLYFLPRDHAVVRWDTRLGPPVAENHDVLLQSPELLPAVSHLFLGPQRHAWAVAGQRCVQVQRYGPPAVAPPPAA